MAEAHVVVEGADRGAGVGADLREGRAAVDGGGRGRAPLAQLLLGPGPRLRLLRAFLPLRRLAHSESVSSRLNIIACR